MRIGNYVDNIKDFRDVKDNIVDLLTSLAQTSVFLHPDIGKIIEHSILPLGIYHNHEGRYVNIDGVTYEIDIELELLRAKRSFSQDFRHFDKIPVNRRFLVLGEYSEIIEEFENAGYKTSYDEFKTHGTGTG